MGKFSGYLICSDYDGTFATGGQPVQENLEALRHFVENGGRFTLATGRTVEFIRDKGLQELINAPACLINGSVVYDYQKDTLLKQWKLDFTVKEFAQCVLPFAQRMERIHIFTSPYKTPAPKDIRSVCETEGQEKALKLLCRFEAPEHADEFRTFAEKQELFNGCYISKSWELGVEFNPGNGTKGHALDFIKANLGDMHTAIGVGNYENDITLLIHGDIAAAPEGSHDMVLDHADMVLCPCAKGAIRDLIERLEKRM